MQKREFEQWLRRFRNENVEMVSVSFDEYQSIFKETVRDQIVTPTCFVETKGESSGLFKKYRLGRGFTNYLLDENECDYCQKHSAAELSGLLELSASMHSMAMKGLRTCKKKVRGFFRQRRSVRLKRKKNKNKKGNEYNRKAVPHLWKHKSGTASYFLH